MRITIIIDDDAFEEASKLTGICDMEKCISEALDVLIKRESRICLIALGGTMPEAENIPRRETK